MSDEHKPQSLADLVKSQVARKQAEELKIEKAAEHARAILDHRRGQWNSMVAFAEISVNDINKELKDTGVSIKIEKIADANNQFSVGWLKITVLGPGRRGNEKIEFEALSTGFIRVYKPGQKQIGTGDDIYFEDAEEDTLAIAIRKYLTEVFSA